MLLGASLLPPSICVSLSWFLLSIPLLSLVCHHRDSSTARSLVALHLVVWPSVVTTAMCSRCTSSTPLPAWSWCLRWCHPASPVSLFDFCLGFYVPLSLSTSQSFPLSLNPKLSPLLVLPSWPMEVVTLHSFRLKFRQRGWRCCPIASLSWTNRQVVKLTLGRIVSFRFVSISFSNSQFLSLSNGFHFDSTVHCCCPTLLSLLVWHYHNNHWTIGNF